MIKRDYYCSYCGGKLNLDPQGWRAKMEEKIVWWIEDNHEHTPMAHSRCQPVNIKFTSVFDKSNVLDNGNK